MRPHFYCKAIISGFLLCLFFAASPALAQYEGFSDPGSRASKTGGSGGIVPVEARIDGGVISVGATAQVVVLFRNEGSQPVQTGAINLYPSSSVSGTVSLNQCAAEPLPSGADCAIALSVKALQAGPWRLEMLMRHSGRSRLVTAIVSGSIEGGGDEQDKLASDIEAIPSEVDFGSLKAGKTLVEGIVLRNITSDPVIITEMYVEASDQSGYNLKADCQVLDAGEACIATITWSPKLKGPSSGVFVIKHDGPSGLSSVSLKGKYEPNAVDEADVFPEAVPGKGLLVSSQTEINFGTGVESASTITISLVNAGDEDLIIQDISIAGKDNGLSFADTGCRALSILQPIEACPLTVLWSPTRVGTLLDDVQIVHNGARGVLILPVRGRSNVLVSQDQKAILLSGASQPLVLGSPSVSDVESVLEGGVISPSDGKRPPPPTPENFIPVISNPASVLDGLKITSFSKTRAIVNGPGGSRILFDGQEALLGGVPWIINMRSNGIEFFHRGQRVLLLFDRSLSPITNISRGGSSSGSSSPSSPSSSGSSSSTSFNSGS